MEQPITNAQSSDTINSKPKNVSSHLWEVLEKRTNEVTQRSTEKRIRHLQKQVICTVTKEFTSPEEKSILEKYVNLVDPTETNKIINEGTAVDSDSCRQSVGAIEELKDFLNVNEHLQQRDTSRPPPPTAIENNINEAIRTGDFKKAESLSDHLATREMGEKIVSAIEAKRFLEQKRAEEASAKSKRKRKLNWGFEPKHRWETKGNM